MQRFNCYNCAFYDKYLNVQIEISLYHFNYEWVFVFLFVYIRPESIYM